MRDLFRELQNRLRKRTDDVTRVARRRGLHHAAQLARTWLDIPRSDGSWNEWEYRTLARLLDRMCNYGPVLPRAANTVALESALEFVDTLPEGRRSQLRDLIALFEAGSLLLIPEGQSRRFTELDESAADAYLRSWASSEFPPRRAAFRAVKSICMVGYWSQQQTWPAIGYSLEDNPGLDRS